MTEINIRTGQGITQAIRDKIGPERVKNADLKTWQAVVKLVDSNPQSQSIFKKQGNNSTQFTTDADKINDKSSNHSNYVVDEGKVTIDNGIWAKIEKLLTGSKTENVGAKGEIKFNENLDELTKKEDKKAEFNEIEKKKFEESLHANPLPNPLESKIDPNKIGTPEVATGKKLTRSVNGKQQTIEIQNINGQKVRFAVNDDGTRGEQLVTVTTAGKNTYVTKSEFDKTVKSALQLGENDEIPKGLNAEYVSIGGEATLVFKGKDGHVMTGSEVKKFMTDYKQDLYDRTAHGSGEYEGKSFKDISKDVLSRIDYSKLSPNFMEAALKQDGFQLNYGGQKYTVHQGNLVDAQGNKFSVQNNKLVPVKTSQEPVQTYGKHGDLNVDNDSSGGSFIKRGRLDFEE